MYGTKSHAAFCSRQRSNGAPPLAGAKAVPRRIALLASGRRHGPITRLITPWDIGELTEPTFTCGSGTGSAGAMQPPTGTT